MLSVGKIMFFFLLNFYAVVYEIQHPQPKRIGIVKPVPQIVSTIVPVVDVS
jgi:hypothetical protein